MPGQLSLHLPLLAFCSGDGDGGGISVDALACWLFQNICNVPRHVPSKGCSEILEQTRLITQLNALLIDKARNPFTGSLVGIEQQIASAKKEKVS